MHFVTAWRSTTKAICRNRQHHTSKVLHRPRKMNMDISEVLATILRRQCNSIAPVTKTTCDFLSHTSECHNVVWLRVLPNPHWCIIYVYTLKVRWSRWLTFPTAVRIYNPRGGKNHVFWIRTCIDILSVYSKVNDGGSAAGDWSIPRCFHWPCQGEGRGRVRNEDVIEIPWNPCEKKISEIRNTSFKCIQMSCFHHIDTSKFGSKRTCKFECRRQWFKWLQRFPQTCDVPESMQLHVLINGQVTIIDMTGMLKTQAKKRISMWSPQCVVRVPMRLH